MFLIRSPDDRMRTWTATAIQALKYVTAMSCDGVTPTIADRAGQILQDAKIFGGL